MRNETTVAKQGLVGTRSVSKVTRSVWGGLHGNLLSQENKTPCFHFVMLRHTLLIQMLVACQLLSSAQTPLRSVSDPGVVTTRQTITPAGAQAIFAGRVHGVSFCGSEKEMTVAAVENRSANVYRLSISSNKILARSGETQQSLGVQGMACVPGNGHVLLSLSTYDSSSRRFLQSVVSLIGPQLQVESPISVDGSSGNAGEIQNEGWRAAAKLSGTLATGAIGGIGLSSDGRLGLVTLTGSNEIALLDLTQNKITGRIPVGIAPFTAVVNRQGTVAWVSNWGGRKPRSHERTAPTGPDTNADRALIDQRGIAANGTVSRVDLIVGRVTAEVEVGLHPGPLAFDEDHNRLYVANSNSDSISVIDTSAGRILASWNIQPFTQRIAGLGPTALALAPDGRILYVACGGINAVAVINTTQGTVEGLIPTGWYPSQLSVSPSGKRLAVSTLLGIGSGMASESTLKSLRNNFQQNAQPGLTRRYVHAYRGTVNVIEVPGTSQLADYTRAVVQNNHLRLPAEQSRSAREDRTDASLPKPLPVPERLGDPSVIEHVVYIVKENRTYDQLFGDLQRGNGDPSLVFYGEDVTPNHRKLALEFVVLDNFYATGGNSGEGHQWVTQSTETDYVYWAGYNGRSYPFDGNDPLAYASSGFLWDSILRKGKTFADFGEFIPAAQYIPRKQLDPKFNWTRIRADLLKQWKAGDQFIDRFRVTSPIPPLDAHLVRDFPGYAVHVPDVVRSRIFLRHLQRWEQTGKMPSLIFVQLPSDHTSGAMAGFSTPKACLADNDLALGQIVEGLTHSRFWPKTAIFVVEDDAQSGVDHVDGHRTVALAISPYVRHHSVDSTFYSHPSIAKTIELMLGLPNLNLFDLIANDMRNSFSTIPDLTAYTAVAPKQSLFEVNPPARALKGQAKRDALKSARMNWRVPDAAPAEELNRILWRQERGSKVPYPAPGRAVVRPTAVEVDHE